VGKPSSGGLIPGGRFSLNSFPAFFPLAGQVVVLVGQGEAAEAKQRLLSQSQAIIRQVQVPEAFASLSYIGARLAFIALDRREDRQLAAQAARLAGLCVNVVDDPELGDFSTPALITRGDVTIAIGTGGTAPVLASLLRSQLEGLISPALGEAAGMIGEFQPLIRSAYPNLELRRAFLRRLLRGAWLTHLEAGRLDDAGAMLSSLLKAGGADPGTLKIVRGDAPLDLMTLGEVRALSDVDDLILEVDSQPHIVNLARRDARRATAHGVSPADLKRWLASGNQIVWLSNANQWPKGLDADDEVQDLRP